MSRSPKASVISPTEKMAANFVQRWIKVWPQAHKYSDNEISLLKSSLIPAVIAEYVDSGKLLIESRDIEGAIKILLLVECGEAWDDSEPGLDAQCLDYLNAFTEEILNQESYTNNEISVIRGRLYLALFKRYKQSGYTNLSLNSSEINSALDAISAKRQKDYSEATLDARDRRIKNKRSDLGPIGYTQHYI